MLAYVLLAAVASAQQYGNGLGKHTYSVSQAHAASQFLMTMLPVQTDYPSKAESCGQLGRTRVAVAPVPNGTCHLHAQGAALAEATSYAVGSVAFVKATGEYSIGSSLVGKELSAATAATPQDCAALCSGACAGAEWVTAPTSYTNGFGLHAVHVNASSARPYGAMSNEQVEDALTAKLDAVRATGAYDAFLDFTTGFWVASLDRLCATFDAVGQRYVVLKWQSYYSVIVRAASSSILIELMSETCATACDAALPHPHARYVFRDGATVASVFGALTDKDAAKPLLHAARVSWPTSNLTRDRAFFVDGGLARVLDRDAGAGVAVDTYDFAELSENAIMQFQLVERPAANTTGPLTVAAWETVMLDTHAAALRDDVCGFDQWMDHHAGLAVRNSTHTLGSLAELAERLGLKYHVNKEGHGRRLDEAEDLEWGSGYALYVSAPNGVALSINGLRQGDYVPSRPIGSGEVDLCNMGTCPNASFLAAL